MQTDQGIEARELPEQAAEQAIAVHFSRPRLELVPLVQVLPVHPAKHLHAPAANEAERNFERAQAVRESLRAPAFNDWARSRASTDAAHRHAVAMGDHS